MKPFLPFLLTCCWLSSALGTVSIEFQLGAIDVPAGSLGVLVADTGGDGFQAPGLFPGVPLSPGSLIGGNDVVVCVFATAAMQEWGSRRGFAAQPEVVDYSVIGVAEGQGTVLYVFPLRAAGEPLRSGEPHVAYRTTNAGDFSSNSNMEFTLPEDGGAYLLSALGPSEGGSADLSPIDIAPLTITNGSGAVQRNLGSNARHTLFLNLTGTNLLTLSTTGPGVKSELYNRSGQLVADTDSNGNFLFEGELDAGFHTLLVYRDPGGSGDVTYAVTAGSVSTAPPRPDVAVGVTLTSLIGVSVYSAPSAQQIAMTSRGAKPVSGYATITNRSARLDQIIVGGTGGSALFKVIYSGASGNLTAGIVSNRYETTLIGESDSPFVLKVAVSPNKKKLTKKKGGRAVILKKTLSLLIRARAVSDPSVGDGGQISVKTL